METPGPDALYQIRRPARRAAEAPSSEFSEAELERPEIDRRLFMQLTGATLGLAGLGGCALDRPRKILPYTKQPPHVLPGEATFYATSMVVDGYASGLLVESHEGRPTKIEANLQHPATLGGTNMFQQAAVRQLYDDMRARRPRHAQTPVSWESVYQRLWRPRPDRGAGLRILLEPTSSPLLLALLARVRTRLPEARFAFFAPLEARNHLDATRAVFGRPLLPHYDFSEAEAILSLDSDFLCSLPFSVRYARQWADRRRQESPSSEMNRLYVAESLLSVTGSDGRPPFAPPPRPDPADGVRDRGRAGRRAGGRPRGRRRTGRTAGRLGRRLGEAGGARSGQPARRGVWWSSATASRPPFTRSGT